VPLSTTARHSQLAVIQLVNQALPSQVLVQLKTHCLLVPTTYTHESEYTNTENPTYQMVWSNFD